MTGPTIIIRDGTNTERTILSWFVRDGTNTEREISAAYVRDTNNVPRLVFNPSGSATLEVAVSPSSVHGISYGTGNATTNSTTATPSGGTAPYTYAWTLLFSDGPVNPSANSASSATTDFTQTAMNPSEAYTSTWQIEVTDDNGATATNTVIANFADAT